MLLNFSYFSAGFTVEVRRELVIYGELIDESVLHRTQEKGAGCRCSLGGEVQLSGFSSLGSRNRDEAVG